MPSSQYSCIEDTLDHTSAHERHGSYQDYCDCCPQYLLDCFCGTFRPSSDLQVNRSMLPRRYDRFVLRARFLRSARRTPVGFIHRVIWIHIPNLASAADRRLTGGRLSRSLHQVGNYLINEANPVVLVRLPNPSLSH